MKKFASFSLVLALVFVIGGCATPFPYGIVYTGVNSPIAVGSGNVSYSKVGTATSKSYFGLVATGDASIEAAKNNGGISEVKYVDYKAENILGIIGTYTTTVYGN